MIFSLILNVNIDLCFQLPCLSMATPNGRTAWLDIKAAVNDVLLRCRFVPQEINLHFRNLNQDQTVYRFNDILTSIFDKITFNEVRTQRTSELSFGNSLKLTSG